MTELTFKGKEFVFNHHLSVPFRPLEPQPDKGIGPVRMDGNLIIHGDNLHALKALLPMYAGKVDCIFIDPPYNTGNEGWSYNDNVNAPMIKEWLEDNPIGIEDGLRHDKWCAMMWPRLRLLHELMADEGSLWVTIDDNEATRLKLMLDEIFGEEGFVANVVWQKKYAVSPDHTGIAPMHDHVFVYSKRDWGPNRLERSQQNDKAYRFRDKDGVFRVSDYTCNKSAEERPNLYYPIRNPHTGEDVWPSKTRVWGYGEDVHKQHVRDNLIWWGADGTAGVPSFKRYRHALKSGGKITPGTWWDWEFGGHNDGARKELHAILPEIGTDHATVTPKPLRLLQRILEVATHPESTILDSFAGSGTTAHAVLSANQRDGGNRRFILAQIDEGPGKANADTLTAERVRRVINGYAFSGTQKTELVRERLNWRALENAAELVQKVQTIEKLEGGKFDKISKTIKDGELIVTGETRVEERAEGLGGAFTYCTLGAPVELDKVLSGKTLPAWEALGGVLFHMATNAAFDPAQADAATDYLGASDAWHVWLIYRPDLDWLKSPEAALTLKRAQDIAAAKDDGKRHLVFAPARFVSQKMLAEHNLPVEFAPLPFALYRIDRA